MEPACLDFAVAALTFGLAPTLHCRSLASGLLVGDSAVFQTLANTFDFAPVRPRSAGVGHVRGTDLHDRRVSAGLAHGLD